MSALREALEDYLTVRRRLGFKLEDYPWMLGDFVTYLEAAGASTVTAELALAWALRPGEGAHPSYLGTRLSVVRGFARHLQAFDPATGCPRPTCCGGNGAGPPPTCTPTPTSPR